MSVIAFGLQLITVFVGAFLAFVLENFRERQQLRGWANDYLRRVRKDLRETASPQETEDLKRIISSYASFIVQNKDHVPSKDEWNSLMHFSLELHDSIQALTESAAARVLPAELVQALAALDEYKHAAKVMTDLCRNAWQQYTVPLVLKQTAITDAERRGLEYTQGLLSFLMGLKKERAEREARVLELLDTYRLGFQL